MLTVDEIETTQQNQFEQELAALSLLQLRALRGDAAALRRLTPPMLDERQRRALLDAALAQAAGRAWRAARDRHARRKAQYKAQCKEGAVASPPAAVSPFSLFWAPLFFGLATPSMPSPPLSAVSVAAPSRRPWRRLRRNAAC